MFVRKPLLVGVTLVLLIAGIFGKLAVIPTAAISQTFTYQPVADTYVNAASPTLNYGASASLRADASPVVNSYIRFNVSNLSGLAVTKATLKVYANTASTFSLEARQVANTTWSETGITYATAPLIGSLLDSSVPVTTSTWVILDVTSFVKGNGSFSFALSTPGSTAVSLASRESTFSPQLSLQTGSSITAAPSRTSTVARATSPTPSPSASPVSTGSQILLLAGDICKHDPGSTDYTGNCKKTGDLVRGILSSKPGAQVQTLGDNVNNDTGTNSYDSEYKDLYAPNWGSFLNVTHALMGNHDTLPPSGTAAYYSYFGSTAGPKPGYYSYNLGNSWHVIVLNAQCSQAGGCASGTPQYTWLKNDLAANTRKCILAVWHQPRWTSGRHTDNVTYAPWWTLLYQYKADIIAGGHNHNYERFNLIDPNEKAASDGIREFVVGTGGAPGDAYTYSSHPLDPNEAIRNQTQVYGVLQLTLLDSSYSWKFLPASGSSFTDSGSTACH